MAHHEELLLNTSSVSPSLFIGLGGSGSQIVERIGDKLRRRWNWAEYDRLVHFFAVDTNISDLERLRGVPPGNRILISDFDKRAYVAQKRGEGHMGRDPFCCQWLPESYTFRSTRGSGAGQVRIESRLSLYYQLERDRGQIIQKLNAAISEAKDHDNPFRRNTPRRFNAFIYGSVAGGTGSGGFLTLAYLVQELIEAAGWIPQVYATLLLPSLFHRVVKGALQPDIDANGYAALMELEHLMKLGYEGQARELEFHYNPNLAHQPTVRRMPFGFVYLVDSPAAVSVAAYKEAVADSAYLQLFSPIIGTQQGEYDNYEKHQKALAHGYAVHYGSYGCSVLVLPDDDLLEYCCLRYAKKAMESYLTFRLPERAGEVARQFVVDYDDPKFKAMSAERRNKVVDDKYREFVRYLGRLEQDSDNPEGPFSQIVHRCERREKKAGALAPELDLRVEKVLKEAKDAIELHTMTPVDITAKNIKVDAEVEDLRQEVAKARSAVGALRDAHGRSASSGSFLRSFFEEQAVDPFGQRYFLIGLVEHLEQRLAECDARRADLARFQLDSDHVREALRGKKELLLKTAEYTLLERLKRRNEDFEEARTDFVRFFNEELAQANRLLLEAEFARDFFAALLGSCNDLLNVYRAVTARASELISGLGLEAERMLGTAEGARGAGEAQEYVLDVEALQDFTGKRLWGRYFDDHVGSGEAELAFFDRDAVFAEMNGAFAPRTDERGRKVLPTADEVADRLRSAFVEMGRKKLEPLIKGRRAGGTDRKEKGLLLDDALRLEARYFLGDQLARDRSSYAPTEEMVQDYLVKKLRFCAEKAAVLATLDEALGSDASVVAANDIYLVGLHGHFQAGGADGLLGPLAKATSGYQLLDDWDDEKRIVFYRAELGIPLYFYRRVNGEMKQAYVRAKGRGDRGYPLHVDAAWEEALAQLDPEERKQSAGTDARRTDQTAFLWALVGEAVRLTDGEWRWSHGGHEGVLGRGYAEAFAAYQQLDARTAARLREVAERAREARLGGDRAALRAELEARLKSFDDRAWELEQAKRPTDRTEVTFLGELQEVVRQLLVQVA
ncbi:MAG: hypothetical protein IT371_09445 [Deltaproteobacteria bacterium]|nr:hypothetical protein [Deltaproteobacteria bacterium]